MTSLESRAEVIKLARELQTEPERLDFLEGAAPEAIRAFRRSVHQRLDAPHRPMFRRIAKVGALVPGTLAVRIAMRYYGPMFVGMVATEVPPARAADLIGSVPPEFIADAAPYVDPEAVGPIVRGLRTEAMLPAMREMLRRKDYVTLARFVSAVSDELILEVLPSIESGADLLMIVLNSEISDVAGHFDIVLTRVDDDRIRSLVQAAADAGLFAETLTFLQFLSTPARARIADAAAELGPAVLTAMIDAAHRENAWPELLSVAAALTETHLSAFAAADAWTEQALTGLIAAADQHDLWDALIRVVAAMPPDRLRVFAELPAWDTADTAAVLAAAERSAHGDRLADLVARLRA
ncbi:hypothetical protein KO481_24035 [Nocardia sp. NEAU-G5]|uniref:DUF2336 domain-containing protein n=1 Tax=Nocardia albiluteola TaxID=2842303 RepID=A0ABS6B610_9NOCA|nr:hypothetical protein [Nocardia albiluteola]MBU3064589.1 hypothetical protein [Nocardia albiluteola]